MNRHRTTLALPIATLLLASCSAIPGSRATHDAMSQDLGALVFSDDRIEEIERLEPQLEMPFRLGIAPPITRGPGQGVRGPWRWRAEPSLDVGSWTPVEREVIERWAQRFVDEGVVREVVMLPAAMVGGLAIEDTAQSQLHRVRAAAAHARVDAVLVVHRRSNAYSALNALAILDLTLIGAAIFPGHDVHVQTAMEALLVDTRNEYLYLTASSYVEGERATAALYAEDRVRAITEATRLEALEALAENLTDAATVTSLCVGSASS